MVAKMKKIGMRFWRRKKKSTSKDDDDAEDLIDESQYAPPTLSRTNRHHHKAQNAKKQQSGAAVADSVDTGYQKGNGNASVTNPKRRGKKSQSESQSRLQHQQPQPPRHPVVGDFDPIEDVSYRHPDEHKQRQNTSTSEPSQSHSHSSRTPTPAQKLKASDYFTPRTVGPGSASATMGMNNNTTPSPTKWQEADKDTKLQYLARLHDLSKEHVKESPSSGRKKNRKQTPPQKSMPSIKPGMIPLSGGSGRTKDTNNSDGNEDGNMHEAKNDEKFIDAVLGVSPGCVPKDTASVIKDYASKPTSPTTVVNFAMLRKGSKKVAELAKDSMRHIMTCAADLNDLKNDSDIGKDLCYAFEHPETFDDGTSDDETYNTYERRQRGRSRSRRDYYNYNHGDDEGTFTGNSLNIENKDGGSSPLTYSASELTHSHDEESLGEVMSRMLKGDYRGTIYQNNEPGRAKVKTTPRSQGQNTFKEQPADSQHAPASPIARMRASSRGSKIHKAASQTSGLTSFRDFASMTSSKSSSTSSPKKHVSNGELAMADPITKDVPFDERSESELRRYAESPSVTHDGTPLIGNQFKQDARRGVHLGGKQHQLYTSMECKPENRRKYLLRFEDESIAIDEGEV